jgi:hypothetical protein
MGKDKMRKHPASRFVVGTHGGCEAQLFEFREKHLPEPNTVHIAATSFDEALTYLRWHEPEFEIDSVQNLGIILLVSGSPID